MIYRISQRQFIDATDVQVVNNTPQKIITLITCDATGARRLMIRGDFVKSELFKQAPVKFKNFCTGHTTGRAS
ncbi:MAG: sortase domain-bontaining protein [Limosilactobacillus pontis]